MVTMSQGALHLNPHSTVTMSQGALYLNPHSKITMSQGAPYLDRHSRVTMSQGVRYLNQHSRVTMSQGALYSDPHSRVTMSQGALHLNPHSKRTSDFYRSKQMHWTDQITEIKYEVFSPFPIIFSFFYAKQTVYLFISFLRFIVTVFVLNNFHGTWDLVALLLFLCSKGPQFWSVMMVKFAGVLVAISL